MASGFFALLDDIASIMDDVATMGKIATKKTTGILGDDLAVNAEKASGFHASREIPVLWAITKGSFVNKLIILPIAFLLSAFVPFIISPILVVGGVYLAFEGVEKIYEFILHRYIHKTVENSTQKTLDNTIVSEKKKIKSAIITDFILSIEIIIIALSTVVEQDIVVQVIIVSFVSIIATIGVYSIVALIVRMDDFGYSLINKPSKMLNQLGLFLVKAMPFIIKSLSVIGTLAMLFVAGGIFVHKIEFLHVFNGSLPLFIVELLSALIFGSVALFCFEIFKKFRKSD